MNEDHLKILITQLASENSSEAEDSQYELESEFGIDAIDPVLDILSELNDFSRRCAIEFLSNVLDKSPTYKDTGRIEREIIPYLESTDSVTRTWVADLLASIGTSTTIQPLLDLLALNKEQKTPPDWTEPTSVRRALRKLGALEREAPDSVMAKMIKDDCFDESWDIKDVENVVECLIKHNQVITNFQIWAFKEGQFYWANANRYGDHELDFGKEWSEVLKSSRRQVLSILSRVKAKKRYRATFDWVSPDD